MNAELTFVFRGNNFTDTATDMYNNHSCPVFSRFRAIKINDENETLKKFSILLFSKLPPRDWRFFWPLLSLNLRQ